MGWNQIANIKGPKGDRGFTGPVGPQGIPGTGAVPADAAVGGYAGTSGTSATKSALIDRAGFFNARTDAPGGVAAALAATDHTTFLMSAFTAAQAAGFSKLYIPQLDPANPSRPWVLSNQLEAYSGLLVDARQATFKMVTIGKPLFFIGPSTSYVTLKLGTALFDIGLGRRPLLADIPTTPNVNGQPPRVNSAAVLCEGAHCTITATRLSGFVFGVYLNTDPTALANREANTVNITVDQVDFGLAYGYQNSGDFTVAGSYVQMTDSTDPAHLVYGTGQLFAQNGNRLSVNAWDSVGGVPVSMKGQAATTIDSIIVRNCPGIMNVVDPLGQLVIGTINATDITNAVVPTGTTSAIETGTSGLVPGAFGTKTIGTARISWAAGITAMRALNLDDDWTVGNIDIEYTSNVTDNGQTMVQLNGNRSKLGPVKIRNKGTGGIRGIRYVAGTADHQLTASPMIIGGADGVTIDPGVLTSVLTVDESTIRPSGAFAALVATPDISNTIRTGGAIARRLRPNRWFAVPAGQGTSIAAVQSLLCVIPVVFQRAVSIDKLGVTVATGAASNVIRMGIYADNGIGYPGALIVDGGTLDASTAGAKAVSFTKITLPPGTYWLAYALQGGTGAALQSVPLAAIEFPAATQAAAISGLMPTHAAVTGALPAAFVFASDAAPSGVAKVAYEVPA